MDLDFRKKPGNGVTIVDVNGDLDLYNAPKFKQAIFDIVDTGAKKVILNMRQVTYIDSSGLGAIIKNLQHIKAAGGDMTLLELQDSPRKVFELSNIISLFKLHEDETAAVNSFN